MDSDSGDTQDTPPRKRRVTDIALKWLAQRLRKSQEIKQQVADGTYDVNSERIAASIMNEES